MKKKRPPRGSERGDNICVAMVSLEQCGKIYNWSITCVGGSIKITRELTVVFVCFYRKSCMNNVVRKLLSSAEAIEHIFQHWSGVSVHA